MKLSLQPKELSTYIAKQLSNFFPDRIVESKELIVTVNIALERAEFCFTKITEKHFYSKGNLFFNHLNTDQYATFLYFLANSIWIKEQNVELATKVYYLNKTLHGLDIYFEIEMPNIFLLAHPLGTVLGRAKYSDYFVCYQGCTVGGNMNLEYPQIGRGVVMYGGSALIGNCKINDNCLISFGTIITDKDLETEIPSGTVVFGSKAKLNFKPTKKSVVERYFIST